MLKETFDNYPFLISCSTLFISRFACMHWVSINQDLSVCTGFSDILNPFATVTNKWCVDTYTHRIRLDKVFDLVMDFKVWYWTWAICVVNRNDSILRAYRTCVIYVLKSIGSILWTGSTCVVCLMNWNSTIQLSIFYRYVYWINQVTVLEWVGGFSVTRFDYNGA